MPLLHHLPSPDLRNAIRRAVLAHGLDEESADYVADTLMYASLRGVDTHGIELLPTYLQELSGGRSKPKPNIRVVRAGAALSLLDGDDGLGVVVGNVAIRQAAELARHNGIGAVAVRNSNHFAAAGYYSEYAARQGMIAFAFSNADALVAAHNGATPLHGTNPIAIAAPALGEAVFSLDMATSQVAYSRVRRWQAEKRPLEPGWAVDPIGEDSAISGDVAALKPVGGYKGQGLAMAVEVLSAVLTAMPFDHELTHLFSPPYDEPRKVGHFFICIDIAALLELSLFRERVSQLTSHVRASSRPAGPPILCPGDEEAQCQELRAESGVPASQQLLSVLAPYLSEPPELTASFEVSDLPV